MADRIEPIDIAPEYRGLYRSRPAAISLPRPTPEEAAKRTPHELAAHERALAAEAAFREASDELIRVTYRVGRPELAPGVFGGRGIDVTVNREWKEANRAYQEARAECDEALRIDNRNELMRMERIRQARIWASEQERLVEEQRRKREAASTFSARIGRLIGRTPE